MQIGIDASRIAVNARTGTEQYSYELLQALARHDRWNHYTLYANQPLTALPPLGVNMAVRRIPFPRLWTHARLSAEVLLHPPDVLFIPAHVVPLGAVLPRQMRTVVTIHDLGYLHFPETHTRAQRLYLRLSTAWSARVANRIIAISGATRDDLIRYTRVAPEKIRVIHHGVSPRFNPISDPQILENVQQRYAIQQPYFLYVGTVQPRKNLPRLLEAMALVEQQAPGTAQLVIAGKRGWLVEQIEQRATALGLADRVHFTGYVADADLPALLSGALAFVFPSLYEGFGMPVLEAMASGTPVLTSNTTALPEVAGDAALLVSPENTEAIATGMLRLIREPTLREELRQQGLERAARFTWDATATATLKILTEA